MQGIDNELGIEAQERVSALIDRYKTASDKRQNWESHWQECYDYALPQRGGFSRFYSTGVSRVKNLFDSTAMDAVDQLAASLLGNLTPPWSQWFGLKPGPDLTEQEAADIAPVIEDIARKIQTHFEHSNFSVEIHQSFLDLAVGGTATLYFEENEPGATSAFKFSAIPLSDVV